MRQQHAGTPSPTESAVRSRRRAGCPVDLPVSPQGTPEDTWNAPTVGLAARRRARCLRELLASGVGFWRASRAESSGAGSVPRPLRATGRRHRRVARVPAAARPVATAGTGRASVGTRQGQTASGLPTTCRRDCMSHPTAGVVRGRQCHTSVVGGSCTCAPRNSTKSAYSTGTGGGCRPATRARNPLAWSRPIALITNCGVLKRSFSFRRKLRFRTPSFEAELQRWAETALPHSKF
jgi:hypothetical protein